MKIIYKNSYGGISIVTPSKDIIELMSIDDLAKKDVPDGVEFWIIEDSDIPTSRVFRDAWELDENELGEPSGVGAPFNEFPEDFFKNTSGGSDDQN